MMQVDVRQTARFIDIEERYRRWYRPGQGVAVDFADVAASPDGGTAAATGSVCEKLEGVASTRIVLIDLATGESKIVSDGPNSDRLPRWSPDGSTIAFLSDRAQPFIFAAFLLDVVTGEERPVEGVDGWIEYSHWSHDGRQLLLGVAGRGADLAGAQGGFSIADKASASEDRPAWLPEVDVGIRADAWRSVWLYDVAERRARRVSPDGINIWEACWCGPGAFVAICSDKPTEEAWYTADVRLFPLEGEGQTIFTPETHLGWLSASPSGAQVAVVEAICSDRTIVAGDVRLIDTVSATVTGVDQLGADVTSTAWRAERHLLMTGGRGPENLILLHDVGSGVTEQLWADIHRTPGGARFPEACAIGSDPRDVVFMREGWFDPPTLVAVEGGSEREIAQLGSNELQAVIGALGRAEAVKWSAPDGLEIQGWLQLPRGDGPHPLVVHIHGGPVWFFRPRYLGKSVLNQALLDAGFAVLEVNPRGSSGRGQDFAGRVFGDMGGADTYDYLSGVDAMVERGIADPERIGVTGGSYGGFMSAWLITQDRRFKAAVPVAPVTDWVSEHLTSHIPYFCTIFLEDSVDNPTGKYHTRSPIHFANQVTTPTLNICGALDRNTPPGQALEFHHALLENGVNSVLVTYPGEGHGVRNMPASFDYVARVLGWFESHMSVR